MPENKDSKRRIRARMRSTGESYSTARLHVVGSQTTRDPFIIAVAGAKGGCGKTTLATNLAAHWHAAEQRVLLVDADPWGEASRWSQIARGKCIDAPPVAAMASPGDLLRLTRGFEIILVDLPSTNAHLQIAVMAASHVALTPLDRPQDLDAFAQMLSSARGANAQLVAACVRNHRSADSRAIEGISVLKTRLQHHEIFQEARRDGMGVTVLAVERHAVEDDSAEAPSSGSFAIDELEDDELQKDAELTAALTIADLADELESLRPVESSR